MSKKNIHRKDILILNRPYVITGNNLDVELFRIPEILNRLRQYREVLNENNLNIPLWVYSLTQADIKNLLKEQNQKPFVLNFLISLGFFDRYISRKGWPQYVVGTDPLMSVIAGEISFEEQALLLSHGYCQESSAFQLYQASSYYNNQTGSFYLTNLKKKHIQPSLEELLNCLKQGFKNNEDWSDWFVQLLTPHEEEFMNELKAYGLFPMDFLESDQNLKWLWPVWKKSQMQCLKNKLAQIS